MQTNDDRQMKNAIEHFKYIYDYNRTFTKESNVGIEYFIRILYAIKQIILNV